MPCVAATATHGYGLVGVRIIFISSVGLDSRTGGNLGLSVTDFPRSSSATLRVMSVVFRGYKDLLDR